MAAVMSAPRAGAQCGECHGLFDVLCLAFLASIICVLPSRGEAVEAEWISVSWDDPPVDPNPACVDEDVTATLTSANAGAPGMVGQETLVGWNQGPNFEYSWSPFSSTGMSATGSFDTPGTHTITVTVTLVNSTADYSYTDDDGNPQTDTKTITGSETFSVDVVVVEVASIDPSQQTVVIGTETEFQVETNPSGYYDMLVSPGRGSVTVSDATTVTPYNPSTGTITVRFDQASTSETDYKTVTATLCSDSVVAETIVYKVHSVTVDKTDIAAGGFGTPVHQTDVTVTIKPTLSGMPVDLSIVGGGAGFSGNTYICERTISWSDGGAKLDAGGETFTVGVSTDPITVLTGAQGEISGTLTSSNKATDSCGVKAEAGTSSSTSQTVTFSYGYSHLEFENSAFLVDYPEPTIFTRKHPNADGDALVGHKVVVRVVDVLVDGTWIISGDSNYDWETNPLQCKSLIAPYAEVLSGEDEPTDGNGKVNAKIKIKEKPEMDRLKVYVWDVSVYKPSP